LGRPATGFPERFTNLPFGSGKIAFCVTLSPAKPTRGDEAWNICYHYLGELENAIADILSSHSVFFWLHLYRRIGVHLSSGHSNKTDANTLGLVREIVDLAISKHGNLEITDDLEQASNTNFKDILGGHYQRLWTKELGKARALAKFEALAKTNQWVITSFRILDFINMYKLEGFAYEYWHVTALMRAIGKGSTVRRGTSDWPERSASPTFRRLIESYDNRISNTPFSTSLVGSWFHVCGSMDNRKGRILVVSYNVHHLRPDAIFSAFGLEPPASRDFVPNFLIGTFDLDGFRKAHVFLSEPFKRKSGIPLDAYFLCCWAFANFAISDDAGYLESQDGLERLEQGELFMSVLHLMQRAYIVLADPSTLADDIVALSKDYEGLPFACDREDVERCLQSLTLSQASRSQIGLWSGGRRFPLVPHGSAVIVDYEGFSPLLLSLFVGVQYEQTERGSIFEDSFRRALEAEGFDLPVVGDIVAKDGSKREIDASVRIGDGLILLECRSIERPLDFEIGRPRTLQRRQEVLDEKVYQVLTLRDFIRSQPVGRNYDFSWARTLEAFVVSPFVEWIWDCSPRLWRDDKTPRILQTDEAISLLREFSSVDQA
jgi:hypothetical protein